MHFKSFDYYGIDYHQSMLDAAKDIMHNSVYTNCSEQQYYNSLKLINQDNLANGNAIIFNTCYLFASPFLNIDELSDNVNEILINNSNKPRFILFQNTVDSVKNIQYEDFKNRLISHTISLSEKVTIKYNNQRNSFYPPVHESVFFEVLKFQ